MDQYNDNYNNNPDAQPNRAYNGGVQPFGSDDLVQNSQADPFSRQFVGSVDSYAPFVEKSKSALPTKLFIIGVITILFLIFIFPAIVSTVHYQFHTIVYDKRPAVVTNVRSESHTYSDEDGDEHTNYTYYVTCSYNYNDVQYIGEFKSMFSVTENDTIEIYVNPKSPSEMMSIKPLPELILEIFFELLFTSGYIIIVVFTCLIDWQKYISKELAKKELKRNQIS